MNLKEVISEALFELGYPHSNVDFNIYDFESTEELADFTLSMIRILHREWWKNV